MVLFLVFLHHQCNNYLVVIKYLYNILTLPSMEKFERLHFFRLYDNLEKSGELEKFLKF